MTHRLYSAGAEGEGDDGEPAADEGEGEEKPEKSDDPKHIFIEQVVRENKMKFFKVPKLGSYLAIRLSYQSCMSEKAIEDAIADKIEVEKRREEQEAERKAYEEDAGDKPKDTEDNEDLEGKVWEEIKEKEYLAFENKYTVCIDTMGQDRALTDDQIRFAIGLVKDYAKTWQQVENENLRREIERKVEVAKKDREYVEVEGPNVVAEEERYIDEKLADREDIETDEQRDRETKVFKLEFMGRQLSGLTTEPDIPDDEESGGSKPPTAKGKERAKPEDKKKNEKDAKAAKDKPKEKPKVVHHDDEDQPKEPERPLTPRLDRHNERWRKEILVLKEAKIIRFPRIFQSVFYLLGYKREDICEPNTNKLWWKKAKQHINDDFFMRLFKYNPVGPKPDEFRPYQKINFIEKLISEIDPEQVEAYSHTFVKLLNWLKLAIDARRENVISRILKNKRLKGEREQAIQQEEERLEERQKYFNDEKEKWEEEKRKEAEAEADRRAREKEMEQDEDEEDEFADYGDDGRFYVDFMDTVFDLYLA